MNPPFIVRSPANLKRAIDSLKLETNPKYKKRDITGDGRDETFCNQAVEALCALLEVPFPKGFLAREQIAWLTSAESRSNGWYEVTAEKADELAELGRPVIIGWTNPDPKKSSHVALMRAAKRIAQAGAANFSDGPISWGFGARIVRMFAHP